MKTISIRTKEKKQATSKPSLMQALLERAEESLKRPRYGQTVDAAVIEKGKRVIYFDMGIYGTGVCYKNEFYDLPQEIKELAEGVAVPVKVINPENDEGYVEVSLRRAGEEKSWEYVEEKMRNHEDITVKILEANRGGLLTRIRGIEAFIPVSQLSKRNYPDVGGDSEKILQELQKFVGREMTVQIIDIERGNKKLILSERAEELRNIREKVDALKVGDIIEGEICGIVDYGAFVRFSNNLEGLIHISELDWQLINNPYDVVKVGDKVKAKIIGLNGDQISLSLKALKDDPWKQIADQYKRGDIITGKVVRFHPYGVFVQIREGVQALVPLSKFKSYNDMREKLKIGETYQFEVFSFDPVRHRMAIVLIEQKGEKKHRAIKDKKAPTKKDKKSTAATAETTKDKKTKTVKKKKA